MHIYTSFFTNKYGSTKISAEETGKNFQTN